MAYAFDPWTSAWAYADALAVGRAGPQAWAECRHRRLVDLIRPLRDASPWWRERLRGVDLAERDTTTLLRGIVPTTKREAMSRFDEWVTEPALALPALRDFAQAEHGSGRSFDGRWAVWESSGSTGEPALFAHDAHSLAVADALEAARGPAAAGSAGGRIAYVGAIDGPYAAIVALQRLRGLNPWLAATTRPFSFLQPADALVEALNDWGPDVLATYPSMAWLLAQRQRAGSLRLALRAVWTGGETLGAAARDAIGHAFGCDVRNSYGASECMAIANECAHGALHLNADWVILEPVDAALRLVPDDEAGDGVLLTWLANLAQPVVRQQLGDRVRIRRDACACGSALPVIEVEGRSDDVIALRAAGGRTIHLAPLALTAVLEEEGGVFDFRVVATGPRALRVELFGTDADARRRVEAALTRHLEAHGLAGTRLGVVAGRAVPGPGGKRRRFEARQRPD